MERLRGGPAEVRVARLEARVGELDRTLVVIESQELLRGQKRGIAVALRKARIELSKLERRMQAGKLDRAAPEARMQKALGSEHLAVSVVTKIGGPSARPKFSWKVDAARRRELERTRLGRRVLCTTRKLWSTERIVHAFRGQWNVEELFRRSEKGCVVPCGPSLQRAEASRQLPVFATVLSLTLVALAKLAFETKPSAPLFMQDLANINATLVRTSTGQQGRRPTVMLPPELSPAQQKAVRRFELNRWMPSFYSTRNQSSPS